VQTFEPEMTSPDRDDARSAILKAARAVAQREGVDNLTLAKVASEAGLPRPAVFGQFVRKEDLLLCVAADSIATLARKMGGIPEPELQHTFDFSREGAVILTLPRSEPAEEVQDVGIAQKSAVSGETLSAAGSERRLTRGGEADGVSLSNESSAEKSPPRAPDAWLERRLRVFERAMTAMEARQEQVEKDGRAMAVSAEDTIKSLEGTISALIARLDKAEAQQKASTEDVRSALSEVSLRIQTVEGVARAALVENDVEDFEEVPVAPAPFEPELAPEVSARETATLAKPSPNGASEQKSFLDVARASAIAAAAAKTEPETKYEKSPRFGVKVAYVVAGLIGLAVFIVAAGIAFSQGVRDGRRDALRQSAQMTPQYVHPASSQTLLDRLTKLAAAGNPNAELAIANLYLDMRGAHYDPTAGVRWMSRAAKQGNALAQYGLGSLYQKGIGTKVDSIQAMHWYEAAALQGNRKAMHDLAIAYAEGVGGVTSASEAVRWFSRAANLGYVDSQFNLAVLYERGNGVPQSLVDAYKWYAIAGAQGDTESKLRIEALRTQLSADDLAAGQRAANAFHALPFVPAANLAPKI